MKPQSTVSRRRFLQASGVCLTLPWLERFASAAEGNGAPNRAVFVFVPNGVNMWEWHPATTGKDYELTPPLKNLADLKQRFTVFSGLQHLKASPGHGELAVWLTANADYRAGKGAVTNSTISIDQHIAGAVGSQTRWPSMVVGATGGRRTISFDRLGQPVLADSDIAAIFSDLVGADPENRLGRHASVLDLVTGQAAALRKELGKSDERQLDEYLESIRAVEKRVQADIAWKTAPKESVEEDRLKLKADPFKPADYAHYIDTMFELIYLALRTDCTRVIAFATTESEGGGPIKNLPCGGWHGAGHNSGDEAPQNKPKDFAILSEYDAWWTARLAKFLGRLTGTKEGAHDMLHHTAVLYGSGMSWPATHRAHNLPLLLAGGEGMGFAQGRHLAFNNQKKEVPNEQRSHLATPKFGPNAVSMSDLLRTMSERMGVPANGFGESRRTLDELLV